MIQRKRIYIVPTGGLANRMRSITAGIALAKKAGKEPIVIWHRDNGMNASLENLFQAKYFTFRIDEPSHIKYNLKYEIPRKKNLYLSGLCAKIDRKTRIYQDTNKSFTNNEKEIERIASNPQKDVIIQSGLIYHPIDRKLINSLFQYSDIVANRISYIKGARVPDITIQIRRTDNVLSIANSSLDKFEKIVWKEIKRNKNISIFLATDDEVTKDYFRYNFKENVFFNPCYARRDTEEGIIDATAELYIMASCKHIYGSYWSSYSEIAALIGGCPLTVVR